MKILSWNVAHRPECWRRLSECDADAALLQEATEPEPKIASCFEINPGEWLTKGGGRTRRWRTAIATKKDRVQTDWIDLAPLAEATDGQLGVSLPGTLAAARIRCHDLERPLTLVSMYSVWDRPLDSVASSWIYADAQAHRLISDISKLVGAQHEHDVIAAGDLNILYGYGENGSGYWADRYRTFFERADSIGLRFVGPQHPNGRQAEPWPNELPIDSLNVPTYHTVRQTPASATRQLDFVFASNRLANRVKVSALNAPDDWGPSDHAQISIEIV